MAGGWVYILASRYRGTLYTGVTADLARRTWQHREGSGSGFARRYEVVRLVYAERQERIDEAIAREKAIKKWRREWKIELIEQANPEWNDLFDVINA
jgi:putative endonuclease